MSDTKWSELTEDQRSSVINRIGVSLKLAAKDRDDESLSGRVRAQRRLDAEAIAAALDLLIDAAFTDVPRP